MSALMSALMLRNATQKDLLKINTLTTEHGEGIILPRSESELLQAIEERNFFVVEHDDNIVACGGSFAVTDNVYELGSCVVAGDFRGQKMQTALISTRVFNLTKQKPDATLFSAIKPSNTRSKRSIARAGFIRWQSPHPAALEPCQGCPLVEKQPICCCDYYLLPEIAEDAIKLSVEQSIFQFDRPYFTLKTTRLLLTPSLINRWSN